MFCSSREHENRAGRKLCQPLRKDDLDTDYVPIGDLTKSRVEARELAITEDVAQSSVNS